MSDPYEWRDPFAGPSVEIDGMVAIMDRERDGALLNITPTGIRMTDMFVTSRGGNLRHRLRAAWFLLRDRP